MAGVFFAIASYFLWGSGDIFLTTAARKTDFYNATFWSSLISLCFFAIISMFFLGSLALITFPMVVVCLAIGVVFLIGSLALTNALIKGGAAVVGTIVGSYGIIVVFLSLLFFHDDGLRLLLYLRLELPWNLTC